MKKKKYSGQAVFSMALALTAAWFAFRRSDGPVALAIPLGIAAVFTGAVAIWVVARRAPALKGTGLGVISILIGLGSAAISFLTLANHFVQPFNPDWQRQAGAERLERAMSVHQFPRGSADAFTSNLPIIVLSTEGESIRRRGETRVRAQFFDATDHRATLGAKPDFEGRATLHLRGHTTMLLPKKSFTLHTIDAQSHQTKVALLGLPKEEDWVLYAPFEDKTLMRDVLAFELTRRMGHYAPRTRFVELFLRESRGDVSLSDYAGVYVLIEKIKRGKERVDIAKLQPDDRAEPAITGGYIVKRDHADDEGDRFSTDHGGPFFFVSPNEEKITAPQKAWLRGYFEEFEEALYGPDFSDPQKGYAAYLDVDAFIDAHWLIEAGRNVDGFRYSAYLMKDRGGKIQPGPPWDWNRAFGNANYYEGWQTEGWYWPRLRPSEISWYRRLRQDPAFVRRAAARWTQLRQDALDPKNILALVDTMASQLNEAQDRNFKRWPVLGEQVTCNFYVGHSYEDEVRWLKNWIVQRIAWIDSQAARSQPADDPPSGSRRGRNL